MQGSLHPDADRQLRARADPPPVRHRRCRVALLEYVLSSFLPALASILTLVLSYLWTDAYLSSVNAKKQAQLALEHQQGLHALEDESEKKIAAIA